MVKLNWSGIWASITTSKPLWIIIGLCVLIAGIAFTIDRCDKWRDTRNIQAKQANINASLDKITNDNAIIANKLEERAAVLANANRDVADFTNSLDAGQPLKEKTNQAFANYTKAVQSNSNVDATAEDLKRVLEELKQADQR